MFRSISWRIPSSGADGPRWRRWLFIGAKLLVTVVAFAALLRVVDQDVFVALLPHIHWGLVAIALGSVVVQILIVAARWRMVIGWLADGPAPPPLRMVSISYAGHFFNQVLPFVAGDGLRAWLLSLEGFRFRLSLRSVLVDRAMGVFALLLIALPSLFLAPMLNNNPAVARPLTLLICGMLAGFAISVTAAPLLLRLMRTWPIFQIIAEIIMDTRKLLTSHSAWPVLGLSLMAHLIAVASVFVIARAIDLPLAFLDCFALVPSMLLVTMVPIAIGGWGVREAVVVTLLRSADIPAEPALLLSLSYGAVLTISALPGIAAWLYLAGSRGPSDKD